MIVDISIVPVSNSSQPEIDITELLEKAGVNYRKTGLSTTVEIDNFKELGNLLDKLNNKIPHQEYPHIHLCCQSML